MEIEQQAQDHINSMDNRITTCSCGNVENLVLLLNTDYMCLNCIEQEKLPYPYFLKSFPGGIIYSTPYYYLHKAINSETIIDLAVEGEDVKKYEESDILTMFGDTVEQIEESEFNKYLKKHYEIIKGQLI